MKQNLTINIKQLTFKCIIGILPFERKEKQRVIINISFNYTYKKDYFIDYSEISNYLKKQMKKKKFELLEEAIAHIEAKLYKMYKINDLKIEIIKPDILSDCIVSLSN
ncbi:dihydroneopterin aldolase [Arcobacter sp. YIC-80]|uniref:dihydroneopterin aldolase n=1 Tax=Arcobacter sp. YIC-80 TaxID=3376683 RepID=UPI0038500E85